MVDILAGASGWLRIVPAIGCLCALAGCGAPQKGPVVFYLDGAGWYTGGGGVESGLRKYGYTGAFETFTWSAFLGPAHDHLVTAHNKGVAQRLADRIADHRRRDPRGAINLVGLSAGTAVILSALEELPDDITVDNVVLLSPTVSAERNLTPLMQHIRRKLYATSSPRDAIVGGLAINADGKRGPPAGERGFRMPRSVTSRAQQAYARVVNLPWRPSYIGFDWNGSHTGVTSSEFIASVIAPRILRDETYPLDRPISRLVGESVVGLSTTGEGVRKP